CGSSRRTGSIARASERRPACAPRCGWLRGTWPRSGSPNGPPTASCAIRPSRGCGPTRHRRSPYANGRPVRPDAELVLRACREVSGDYLWSMARRALAVVVLATSCYRVLPGSGGGRISPAPPRSIHAADVALNAGYRIEPVITGLTFPTSVTWDESGRLHI